MAEYRQPTPSNAKILDRDIITLTNPYGGSGGEEGALLNGLLALGYDPALIRSFADANPNGRSLLDAVTKAMKGGISEDDVKRALTSTRAAATGDPQGALKALGVNPNDLPPESRGAYDAIANRQPLPFLDRGQVGAAGAAATPPAAPGAAPRGMIKDFGTTKSRATPGVKAPERPSAALKPPEGSAAGTQGAGAGGGAGGNSTLGLTPKKPVTDEEVTQYVYQHFGSDAWWMDVPDVRKVLFDLARTGSTDVGEAARQVQATNWYKTTAEPARAWTARQKHDPASILSDIGEQSAFLQGQADELGITIDPSRMSTIAENSLKFGWSPTQIKKAIGAEYHYDPQAKSQPAKITAMKQLAGRYLIPMADDTIKSWGEGVMTGSQTETQFQDYLRDQAKSLFPSMTAAIDSGLTVEDYVNPYKQLAAQTLEVPTDSINFMDPKWRKALDQQDPKTGMRTTMTLSDWQATLKTDKQYGYDKTKQGVAEGADLATTILKKFGKIA